TKRVLRPAKKRSAGGFDHPGQQAWAAAGKTVFRRIGNHEPDGPGASRALAVAREDGESVYTPTLSRPRPFVSAGRGLAQRECGRLPVGSRHRSPHVQTVPRPTIDPAR